MPLTSSGYVDLSGTPVDLQTAFQSVAGASITLDVGVFYAIQNTGATEIFLAEQSDGEGIPVSGVPTARKLAPGDDVVVKFLAGQTIFGYTLSGVSRLVVTQNV